MGRKVKKWQGGKKDTGYWAIRDLESCILYPALCTLHPVSGILILQLPNHSK